jgi:hypothetical protein
LVQCDIRALCLSSPVHIGLYVRDASKVREGYAKGIDCCEGYCARKLRELHW